MSLRGPWAVTKPLSIEFEKRKSIQYIISERIYKIEVVFSPQFRLPVASMGKVMSEFEGTAQFSNQPRPRCR